MSWIERGVAWFWERVSASTVPALEGLGFLRILCGLFLMLIVPPYSYWVGGAPPTFFKPPSLSVMGLFSGFPSSPVMWLADITAFALGCCLLLGVYARVCTLLLVIVGVLSSNAAMCFGKIDHDCMLWTFLACMSFSGWGRTLALRPDKPSRFDQPYKAFALMAVCLGFAMSAIGYHKALGWVDFDLNTNGFLGWFVQGYFVDGRRDLLANQVPSIPPLGLELMDYAGVVFEGSCFIALLIGRRVWRIWCLSACLFHLTNILTLNIPFLQNVFIYLAFVDFGSVERKLIAYWRKREVRIAFAVTGVAMVVAHLLLRRAGIGRWLFFVLDESHNNHFVLRFSAALYVVAFLVVLDDLIRRWRVVELHPAEPEAELATAEQS